MVVAQAIGEYVAASVVASAFRDLWLSVQFYLSSLSSSTWLIVGGCVALVSYLWLRSS